MKIVRFVLWAIVAIVVSFVAVGVAARFSDGPIALFPGGPFSSGEVVTDPNVDWTFAKDLPEMELASDGRSRTVWLLVHEGELYVPASVNFPPMKNWHLRALEDPRAEVRIAGKRYARELHRVEDPSRLEALRALARDKYQPPPGSSGPDDVWFFHLAKPKG